jgi:hypothetical protein
VLLRFVSPPKSAGRKHALDFSIDQISTASYLGANGTSSVQRRDATVMRIVKMRKVVAVATAVLLIFVVSSIASAQPATQAPCRATVAHYRDGQLAGQLCESNALSLGLTIIDLGDRWVPFGLRGDDTTAAPDYQDTYLALANQDIAGARETRSRGLGFYGIFPNLSLIARRLEQEERYQCHAAVVAEPVPSIGLRLVEENAAVGRARVRAHDKQRQALEVQMHKRHLGSFEELASENSYFAREVEKLAKREARTRAIRRVQEHLLCESETANATGLLVDGVLSWRTTRALRIYQRQHFLPPTGWIDAPVFHALQAPQQQNDWRSALRVLRERVVDATGLIEDGSAINESTPVLAQLLDPIDVIWPRGYSASPDGERDRIGAATDRAARHLGWRDAESVVQFLRRHVPVGGPNTLKVAVKLPPLPDYYSKHINLRVVIDLATQTKAKNRKPRKKGPRPALLLYVDDGASSRLLARWPTTVGGWQDERLADGAIVKRFKASNTGDFVWKNLYMAPRWLAPETTPHDDVIKRNEQGRWSLDRDVLGPSFRSAYGLAMLILHKPYKRGDETRFADQGIRVHGTGNILSLGRGFSHGCHRLLGFHVLRLSAFLLRHRNHVRVGPEKVFYQRTFRKDGAAFPITLDQRGYRFDLTPPVPVRVNP